MKTKTPEKNKIEPLTDDEKAIILFAEKEGCITEDTAQELLGNPKLGRIYIGKCELAGNKKED